MDTTGLSAKFPNCSGSTKESQRDVVYLGWPVAHFAGSQPMSTVQLCTWSLNIFWRFNSIFNLWGYPSKWERNENMMSEVLLTLLCTQSWAWICKPFKLPRIDSQPGGQVRQRYIFDGPYQSTRLHRLAKSIPRLHKRLQIRALIFWKLYLFKSSINNVDHVHGALSDKAVTLYLR